MKFLSGSYSGKLFYGVLASNEHVLDLTKIASKMGTNLPETLLEGIQMGLPFIDTVKQIISSDTSIDYTSYTYSLADSKLKLLAPIPRPTKNIMCVGKNYREHVIEMGSVEDVPEYPMIFTKAPTSVIGHLDSICSHADITNGLDYEGELAVVIGKKGSNIPEKEAEDYIFGYTILNDITARDLQARHKQFFLGKSLDTSCPIGPYLVHKSEVNAANNLRLTTKVNGELRQDSSTNKMIFDIPTLIAVLSKGITLEPGDIIATGTPSGVGKGFKPPRFLKKGDLVEITIEGIGTLTNQVV